MTNASALSEKKPPLAKSMENLKIMKSLQFYFLYLNKLYLVIFCLVTLMQHVQQKNQCFFYFKKDETLKNTCFQVKILLPMTRTLVLYTLYSTHNCCSRRVLWGLPDGVQEAIDVGLGVDHWSKELTFPI